MLKMLGQFSFQMKSTLVDEYKCDRLFLWFDLGFLVCRKTTVKPQKTTIMSGVLTVTGSRKANHRRSTHTPRVNSQTYSTHTTYHTPQATFHTTTKPHDTTPHQVTSRQSRPHQQQQPIRSRPFPVQGECSRCQSLTRRSIVDPVGKGLR